MGYLIKTAEAKIVKEFRAPYKMKYYRQSEYDEFNDEDMAFLVDDDVWEEYYTEAKQFAEEDFNGIGEEMLSYLKRDLDDLGNNITGLSFTLDGKESVMTVTFDSEPSSEELEKICDWITGQYSDGWGEGLEQRDFANWQEQEQVEIEDEDGRPYYDVTWVTFWLFMELYSSGMKLKIVNK